MVFINPVTDRTNWVDLRLQSSADLLAFGQTQPSWSGIPGVVSLRRRPLGQTRDPSNDLEIAAKFGTDLLQGPALCIQSSSPLELLVVEQSRSGPIRPIASPSVRSSR